MDTFVMPEKGDVMADTDNVAVVRSVYEGFNARDMDKLFAALAPDFTLVDVPTGQTFTGAEGFMAWVQPFAVLAPDSMTEITHVIADGEWVFTEHTGRGTHTGPLVTPAGEIAPTGRSFALLFAEVFHLRDGKIDLMRAYYDFGSLLRQLGVQ
jgi:steroid delta-isomerase-like uncharacterized protein